MKRSGGKVLIVDDERLNITVLAALMEDEYDIVVAKNGEQALKRAHAEQAPDLILLDVIMPDIDGYEVCRRLKEDESTRHIPIIFITVKGTVEEETRGLEMGAVDYITKPFSPAIVKARVANHIELKRQRDMLQHLNLTDPLTGIANRRYFDDYLNHEMKQSEQNQSPLSLVMLDIDSFKDYNDNYGHNSGDKCLRQVATALDECSEGLKHLIARFGGEEFALILPGATSEQAINIAEKHRQFIYDLNIPHKASAISGRVSISLGIAGYRPGDTTETLIERADKALYRAKHGGRNKSVLIS